MKPAPNLDSSPTPTTIASLVAAPALLLASALVMPALASDEQKQLRTVATHSTRYLWFTLLLVAGTMLFVPAFHGLSRLTRRSRALRVGSALVVFGAMASVGDATTQFLIRQLATRGHATPDMAAVITAFDSSTGAAQLFALGGLALTGGGITVGIALQRAGLISWLVAAAFAAALVANLAGFIAQSTPIIAGSSGLLLITMAAIAAAVSRRTQRAAGTNDQQTTPAATSAAGQVVV